MKKIITRLFMIAFLSLFYPLDLGVVTLPKLVFDGKMVLKGMNLIFLQEFFESDTTEVQKYLSVATSEVKNAVFVSILKQELIVFDFTDTFKVVFQTKISTGKIDGWTPRGKFNLSKKRISRESKAYGGIMTFWNCLTPDERIGIHGLRDKSYEKNLGKPASHGCIRISSQDAPIFYALCPVGTTVFIE